MCREFEFETCLGRFSRRKLHVCEAGVPAGDREETSREKASPQAQPQTPLRLLGDARQGDLREGEEGQGTVW